MAESSKCRECGASVHEDAPRGLCPRCLLNVASDPNATATFQPPARPSGPRRAAASVDRAGFLRGVRDLNLVPEPELEQLDKATPGDANALANALIQVKRLTPYQASALAQGKGRGLLIGSYLVLDRLGRGGMGMVFKALHRSSGQKVALKILPPSFARDPDAVRRFRREFQVASRLSHPNLVAAIEASEDRGVHYLTMEYIPGYDLDRLVSQGGPMELRLALHCVIQVARGLEEAHEQGVIHRDIKPGNVMIDPAGTVRVLDLGLARVTRANDHFGQTAAGSLTQTGAYMGTVDFLAPEQADDAKSADARADIYSLGCTLYFLLTGRAPFAGDSVLKRLMAHQTTPPPSLREARPDVPEQLDRIYLRMMAKRPGGRPQTMSELILDLEACRANPREAGDVSVDLKTFARTALKRAPDRKNRGPDDSVFARPGLGEDGLVFDPNLSLEDLVAGYREERGREPLSEDKLPPIARHALPPRPKRRRSRSGTNGVVAFFVVGFAIAGYTMWPKAAPKEEVPVVERSKASPVVPVAQAKAEPKKGEFRPLFNGKDLSGWEIHPSQPGGWKVENGLLIGRSGSDYGYLYTSGEFGDVHIRAEVRINEGGNSGLLARSSFGPKIATRKTSQGASASPVYASGYELAIDSTVRKEYNATTGSLFDHTGNVVVRKTEATVPPGEWATVELIVRGDQIDTRVNGKPVAHHLDRKNGPARGRIALQFLKETVVEFRKIEVKEIVPEPAPAEPGPLVSIFNGKDITDWAGQTQNFEVRDGAIRAKVRGQSTIYHPRVLRDFEARLEFKLTDNGNGGVVLHYPGKGDGAFDGLTEIEIVDESRYKPLHPTQYTGSAYGMVAATTGVVRPVGQWNDLTAIVRGTTVTVILNGVKVLDDDVSKVTTFFQGRPHPGQTETSGFFGLTNVNEPVEFRNIRVRDLPPIGKAAAPSGPGSPGEPPRGTPWSRELSDPYSGMPDIGEADRNKPRPFNGEVGYDRGVWHYNATQGSVFSVPIPYPRRLREAEIVVPARVVGDAVRSKGSVKMHLLSRTDPNDPKTERGVQMRVDGLGRFFLEPSFWTAKHAPDGPWKGPVSHPAIQRGGGAFNVWTIRVRRRSLQVLINGAEVLPPTEFDYDLTPGVMHLGVQAEDGIVRAEYDRIEIREYAPGSPEPNSSAADPRLGNLIAAEEFGSPSGPLPAGVFPTGKGLQPNMAGNEAGVYFLLNQGNWQGANNTAHVFSRRAKPFQVEVTGRVLGGTPDAAGSWGFAIETPQNRGLHVSVHRDGMLRIERPWWTPAEFKDEVKFAPFGGRFLRAPDRFNTIGLRVENRKVALLINREPVGEPIPVDFDLLPASGLLILTKPDFGTTIRAEYDRVEVREWNP